MRRRVMIAALVMLASACGTKEPVASKINPDSIKPNDTKPWIPATPPVRLPK